jgi:hypothetical protein
MCCSWWHFCYPSLLAILRKKIGKPRKEIGDLNGFEYRYLNGFKVPHYSTYPLLSIKVISMGMHDILQIGPPSSVTGLEESAAKSWSPDVAASLSVTDHQNQEHVAMEQFYP